MRLTVTDSAGAIVAHVVTDRDDAVPTLVVGRFEPGPGFAMLRPLLDEFHDLYERDLQAAATFHDSMDLLALRATDEQGRVFSVCNILFQQDGLLFSLETLEVGAIRRSGLIG